VWHALQVDESLLPRTLTWDEVDPGTHPFDAVSAPHDIRGLAPAIMVPVRPCCSRGSRELTEWAYTVGWEWLEAMTQAMIERWGRWVTGWRWSPGEGDLDGGPVHGWCCTHDSVNGAGETLPRVSGALAEWRSWLEDLAERFNRYPLTGADDRVLWERGMVHLVHHVLDRTMADSGWYQHCEQVLSWYLARWGVPAGEARHLVTEAIGGRFQSWIEPAGTDVEEVAERLASSFGELGPMHDDA
jgi:hypothetical protein